MARGLQWLPGPVSLLSLQQRQQRLPIPRQARSAGVAEQGRAPRKLSAASDEKGVSAEVSSVSAGAASSICHRHCHVAQAEKNVETDVLVGFSLEQNEIHDVIAVDVEQESLGSVHGESWEMRAVDID